MTEPAPSVCFIVESGTDARLVEGLAARVRLIVLARAIPGGRAISQPTDVTVMVAEPGRLVFAWRVFWMLLRRRCDAVLVQGYGVAALAANIASRLRQMPCWMLVCSPIAEYYEARRRTGRKFSRLTLEGIHLLGRLNGAFGQGFIVLSEYLRDIVHRYGPGRPIEIVPVYGVDVARFTDRPNRSTVRTERGLPARGQIIFSSSRVAPEKDTVTLLDAFARLVREGRDVYLLNRSGGYEELLRHGERLGVAERLIATDAVDPRGELPLDYVAADVCVQASREEGLGFSVLEALACGTPVIASAVGGLRETVRDGVTGWSVPSGDPAALATALRDALDHPDEARRRAAAGAAMVRERFESNSVFGKLVEVLTDHRRQGRAQNGRDKVEGRADGIRNGHYYRKLLGCKSGVIAWSHRSRFRVGLELIGSPRTLLDYGCGDGTFLAMAAGRIQSGCGVDIAAEQIEDCRARLAPFVNLRFCTIPELAEPSHDRAYDVVTCMETLEHCTLPVVDLVLRDLVRVTRPDGRIVISVPIETGPTFLLKLAVRKAAAWRGLSDYRHYETYPLADAARMIFASRTTAVKRPVYGPPDAPSHSHYGFNWRALQDRVSEYLIVERTLFSPLGRSRGWASSQAWFVCRPRIEVPPQSFGPGAVGG